MASSPVAAPAAGNTTATAVSAPPKNSTITPPPPPSAARPSEDPPPPQPPPGVNNSQAKPSPAPTVTPTPKEQAALPPPPSPETPEEKEKEKENGNENGRENGSENEGENGNDNGSGNEKEKGKESGNENGNENGSENGNENEGENGNENGSGNGGGNGNGNENEKGKESEKSSKSKGKDGSKKDDSSSSSKHPSTNSNKPLPPGRSGSSSGTPSGTKALPGPATKSPAKGPPPPENDGPSSDEKSSSSNMPVIIGVAVGIGLFLVLILVVSFIICAKKKKRKNPNALRYYDSSAKGGGNYYNSGNHQPWQKGGQEYGVKLPPPPGGGWQGQPGPPPMMSGEMSSGYSGPHSPSLPPPSPSIALGFNKSTFSLDELAAATGGFSDVNLLGQGGFGYVHKGVLPNGKEIAVKQLKSGSGQGEREFQAEVEIISRVHHRHLVSLVGYCITGAQRMLVYEYVPNKTLEYHLHGKGLPVMDWPTRLKIALGSAKGLAYLHEDCHPRIIHRDIKSANILLDYKFEAMVADFGLAKLSSDNYTHVSTRVMGTFGYLAPEYASSGKLTEKSDVFSFGIMLLELITGRRPIDTSNTAMDDSLVDWARPIMTRALNDGNFHELVDPRLGNFNPAEMTRIVACAAASVRHSARRRPKMSQIVRALEGDASLDDLTEGVKPGQSTYFGSDSDYTSGSYASNMDQFRRLALDSTAYSGDYGMGPSSSGSEGYSGNMNQHKHPRN